MERIKAYKMEADIYRRALLLAEKWTAFDPYGAQVYDLRDLIDDAFGLRERMGFNLKDKDWNILEKASTPVVRKIREEGNPYMTFRNHVKGIEGAVRRLVRNPIYKRTVVAVEYMDGIKRTLKELHNKGCF